MPSLKRFIFDGAVYHTISATRGRTPVFQDPQAAEILLDAIGVARVSELALILAYAILPDHLHLLCVPLGEHTVSDVMKAIKGASAKTINKSGLHSGPVWQQGYYDRVIRTEEHLNTTLEYIHRNPVAAGQVTNAQDYRFSSAHPEAATDLERFLNE